MPTDYINLYTDYLAKNSDIKKPLSVVCDCSNGSTGKILESLLPKLNLKNFKIINSKADPEFPAHGPNPLVSGASAELQKTVLEEKADLGLILDADGDRAFFVDEKGELLPSFITASLLFRHRNPPYVADELVYEALNYLGLFEGELFPSRVGFLFVRKTMAEHSATSGAEFSGHYCFKDFFNCDSGLFALVTMLSILSSMEQTLAEYAHSLPTHVVRNADVKLKTKSWEDIKHEVATLFKDKSANIHEREGITIELAKSWVNVRPSNTEPILRIYAGSKSEAESLALIEHVKTLVV